MAVIDLHSHVLAGLDDGAQTLKESLAIVMAAVAEGIERIAATPHVRGDYPTSADEMERAVGELRSELRAQDVFLDVLTGGEVALDHLALLSPDDLRRFGLGGNPHYLLIEFPYYGWPLSLSEAVFRLRSAGITAVLAHPERNAEVQESPGRLEAVVEQGAIVQLTAASLDGRSGRRARVTAFELLDRRLAHLVASDAHGAGIRAMGFDGAARALDNEALARWLMRDVPAAIVAREPLPPRADSQKRLRRWFGRG